MRGAAARPRFGDIGTAFGRSDAVAKKPRIDDLAAKAKFVFEGTVQKEKATTMKEVEADDRTVVVRVDRITAAPESLAGFAGQQVTVQLGDREERVARGKSYVFYTNGWVFGDGLAVRSVGHERATKAAAAAVTLHPDDPARSLASREADAQAAAAALIVSGRVTAVRLPKSEAKARAALAVGQRYTADEPISEHAPVWREAVIDIDKVHRGSHKAKQVVVRFPSSTDVRWHRAPKFHAGQEGVFLLHKGQAPAGAKAALAAVSTAPNYYTALDPADVQPLDELPRIIGTTRRGES
jgi:hypothetical protein